MTLSADGPLVSICMPLYNAEAYIEETLTKLTEQTYSNIEVIIVNDHSTDRSLEIARKFESDRIKVFTNEGKGACSARNYAFRHASGEYIKFMDSDDYCTSELIERQVEALQSGTKKTIVFSPLKLVFPDGRLLDPERSIDHDYEDAFDLQVKIMDAGGTNVPHCYLMPRELVETSGGWDESIRKNQDGEYFSRVLAHADRALSVADAFAIYRKTGTGLSKSFSHEAVSSKLQTYEKIMSLAIDRYNTDEMRTVCGRWLGRFVYANYPELKSILNNVEEICKGYDVPLLLPERRVLKVLRQFLGWKKSVALMHKVGLVKRPD